MSFFAKLFNREADEKTVLPSHLSGGPHGLGDPADRTLRVVEKNVLIPKHVREVARSKQCGVLAKEMADCARESGVLLAFSCRSERDNLYKCMEQYYNDPEFVAQMTEEYLQERSEYRRTGMGAKHKKEAENV